MSTYTVPPVYTAAGLAALTVSYLEDLHAQACTAAGTCEEFDIRAWCDAADMLETAMTAGRIVQGV